MKETEISNLNNLKSRVENIDYAIYRVSTCYSRLGSPEGPKILDLSLSQGKALLIKMSLLGRLRSIVSKTIPEKTIPALQKRKYQIEKQIENYPAFQEIIDYIKNIESLHSEGYLSEKELDLAKQAANSESNKLGFNLYCQSLILKDQNPNIATKTSNTPIETLVEHTVDSPLLEPVVINNDLSGISPQDQNTNNERLPIKYSFTSFQRRVVHRGFELASNQNKFQEESFDDLTRKVFEKTIQTFLANSRQPESEIVEEVKLNLICEIDNIIKLYSLVKKYKRQGSNIEPGLSFTFLDSHPIFSKLEPEEIGQILKREINFEQAREIVENRTGLTWSNIRRDHRLLNNLPLNTDQGVSPTLPNGIDTNIDDKLGIPTEIKNILPELTQEQYQMVKILLQKASKGRRLTYKTLEDAIGRLFADDLRTTDIKRKQAKVLELKDYLISQIIPEIVEKIKICQEAEKRANLVTFCMPIPIYLKEINNLLETDDDYKLLNLDQIRQLLERTNTFGIELLSR